MTKDTIFLMIVQIHERNYDIFEYVEENETLKLTHVADFGNRRNGYFLWLPQIIKPMENGKFIFFPREAKIVWQTISFDAIEVWEKNKTLTRSPLELPKDLQDTIDNSTDPFRLWILHM